MYPPAPRTPAEFLTLYSQPAHLKIQAPASSLRHLPKCSWFFSPFTSKRALKESGGGKVGERVAKDLERSLPKNKDKSGKKLTGGIYKHSPLLLLCSGGWEEQSKCIVGTSIHCLWLLSFHYTKWQKLCADTAATHQVDPCSATLSPGPSLFFFFPANLLPWALLKIYFTSSTFKRQTGRFVSNFLWR